MPQLNDRDRRTYWESLGAVDNRGQFKQWLHVFGMAVDRGSHYSSMLQHHVFPWLPLMPRPDLAEIEAIFHMTKLQNWPSEWPDLFWYHLAHLRADIAPHKSQHGPYWMLLSTPTDSACAQVLVGMKRRLTNELFKEGHAFSGPLLERRIIHAMAPFSIYPQQESNNEVD